MTATEIETSRFLCFYDAELFSALQRAYPAAAFGVSAAEIRVELLFSVADSRLFSTYSGFVAGYRAGLSAE